MAHSDLYHQPGLLKACRAVTDWIFLYKPWSFLRVCEMICLFLPAGIEGVKFFLTQMTISVFG